MTERITNERLKQIFEGDGDTKDEATVMARELLAYRESRALEALRFIADREDFTFAECSLAEEIVSRARAAKDKLEAIAKLEAIGE